jgi:hypothetical protein
MRNVSAQSREPASKWWYVVFSFVGIAIVTLVAFHKLPEWKPDWVMKHSTSPERVFRASCFAFNGHFDATPALKRLLGEDFDDFLEQKLLDPSDEVKEQTACIFAYSDDPRAEKALMDAYLRGQSEDAKRSILFFLGWTATDQSRVFLTDILEGHIAGPRWSAVRALAMSTIRSRYEIISGYVDDPDGKVKKEVELALERKLEDEFEELVAEAAPEILSLAKRLFHAFEADIPRDQLPKKLGGRAILWGRIHKGVLDLRFDDNKNGLLINPSGSNGFPLINGYLISGGEPNFIAPYRAL